MTPDPHTEPRTPKGVVSEPLSDVDDLLLESTGRLVIAFRRWCQRQGIEPPSVDQFQHILDEAGSLQPLARLRAEQEGEGRPRCTRARHDEHCADLHWESVSGASGGSVAVQSREGQS